MREVPFGRPIIGDEERKVVQDVLSGFLLVHGPRAHDFEHAFAQWTGAPHCVTVSSATAALHLCYFHLGLKAGDEVIVPAQTHVATAHAVELTGAKPVFVDAEIRTGNIDIDQIEAAITPRTKAIGIVHYLGMPVAMERVTAIAEKHGLAVIEDCALAIGTKRKGVHAGLFGDAGCYSFYPVKHMTTAEGGMLMTRHESWAKKIEREKAFGVDRHQGERKIPGIYDVTMLGFNYRMNEIQAAIGIEQVKRLDGFLAARERNYGVLRKGLLEIDGITLFDEPEAGDISSRYCLSIILSDALAPKRFEIVADIAAGGVGTSIYYPRAVPHFTYYRDKYGYGEDTYPVAAKISGQSIALPVGPHLNEDDMTYVVEVVKQAIRRHA